MTTSTPMTLEEARRHLAHIAEMLRGAREGLRDIASRISTPEDLDEQKLRDRFPDSDEARVWQAANWLGVNEHVHFDELLDILDGATSPDVAALEERRAADARRRFDYALNDAESEIHRRLRRLVEAGQEVPGADVAWLHDAWARTVEGLRAATA